MTQTKAAGHVLTTPAALRDVGAHLGVVAAAHLPPAERVLVIERAIVSTSAGVPDRAVARAAASIATATSAAAWALDFDSGAADSGDELLRAAADAMMTAADAAESALRLPGHGTVIVRLAEATGYAAHLCADALAACMHSVNVVTTSRQHVASTYPRGWRLLIDGLAARLVRMSDPGVRDLHDAAAIACAGAVHVQRAYDRAAVGAPYARFARLAGLAAAYAGWGAVMLQPVD